MPNAERAARLNSAVAKAFGEGFTFFPRTQQEDVDLPRVPDPDREEFTATGTWFSGAKPRVPRARGSVGDDQTQGAVVSSPRADFATADLVWTPNEGDLCRRDDTKETFAVGRTMPNGFSRIMVYFTAKKR